MGKKYHKSPDGYNTLNIFKPKILISTDQINSHIEKAVILLKTANLEINTMCQCLLNSTDFFLVF
jgi:hypothetical protein